MVALFWFYFQIPLKFSFNPTTPFLWFSCGIWKFLPPFAFSPTPKDPYIIFSFFGQLTCSLINVFKAFFGVALTLLTALLTFLKNLSPTRAAFLAYKALTAPLPIHLTARPPRPITLAGESSSAVPPARRPMSVQLRCDMGVTLFGSLGSPQNSLCMLAPSS